ncbi:putative slowpoke-binding protein isoform X2 [Apostichopus japonicus]|uniref:Putative slowpoke-binding protein isoform X2 n=1 Tax=Stichopus japonicus TaxID=307972 RepID=A0A2G8KI30_STIJA|nr:putative slowpoke-binding protein isoform X2 [Apostichopus japonicus]
MPVDFAVSQREDKDTGNFLPVDYKKLQHMIAAVCSGAAVLVILVLALVIYCYRRCSRYDYTPLLEDLSLPVKLKREREMERNSVREEALINCQFYLRSHSGHYSYMGYLPNMGTRLEKHWFLVRQMRQTKDLIMNVWKKSPNCPLQFDGTTQKTLKELFRAISHPYIWPVLDLDLWTDQSLVISVQNYEKRGSLKDHIYGVSPNNYVEDKYGMKGRALPSNELKLFGLQVLQALIYLEEQGFPYHGNVHSGNVILERRTCRLAGYENVCLGYASQLHPVLEKYFRDNLQSLDSLSFGHMMFEMSSGETLTQAFPDRIQLQKCKQPGVKELLEYIFDVNGDYPSIRYISEHGFFVGVRLKHLESKPPKQSVLDFILLGKKENREKITPQFVVS